MPCRAVPCCAVLCRAVLCRRAQLIVEDSIDVVKESFDNDVTPYYALVIAIWGQLVLSRAHTYLHTAGICESQLGRLCIALCVTCAKKLTDVTA